MVSRLLYNIGIQLYLIGTKVYSLRNGKARKWLQGRKNQFSLLEQALRKKECKRVWIHCASLGEFEQGRPVIEGLSAKYPGIQIILTFFSPSGYEVRKEYDKVDHVFYLPLDTAKNASQFLDMVLPDVVLFVKYEHWYHFLRTLHERQIPVILFSAIFRKRDVFFKWYGGIFREILHHYSFLFLQDQHSVDLLTAIGVDDRKLAVAPDTRFDRAWKIAKNAREYPEILEFANGRNVVVAGSAWPDDIDIMKKIDKRQNILIIAPHNISEDWLNRIEASFPGQAVRYSRMPETPLEHSVLIIDNIGMLADLYQYATVAYVGGGFGKGIHNTLEPAAHGVPVIFGPKYGKFHEARLLLEVGGAFASADKIKLAERINVLLADREYQSKMGKAARELVSQNLGGTGMVMEKLAAYL